MTRLRFSAAEPTPPSSACSASNTSIPPLLSLVSISDPRSATIVAPNPSPSVHCATDNLLLCNDCDWDSHGSCPVSALLDRNLVEGLLGSPTALKLASAWGVNLEDKKPQSQLHLQLPLPVQSTPNWSFQDSSGVNFDSWMYKSAASVTLLQDLMVSSGNNAMMDSKMGLKRQSPSCGKQNQVLLRQLMELFKREVVGVDDDNGSTSGSDGGGGENLVSNM